MADSAVEKNNSSSYMHLTNIKVCKIVDSFDSSSPSICV